MDGVFVLGTSTDVGKTVFSGGLLKMFQGTRARYWKPIQTGTIVGDDTADLKQIADAPAETFLEPVYRFPEPLSPVAAARKWNKTVEISEIVKTWRSHAGKGEFIVIEGAGGVYLPLNEKALQIDLMTALGVPVVVLSNDSVGAINHTLLTLKALNDARLNVLGVVLMKSRGSMGNAEEISHYGKVEVLAEFPPSEDAKGLMAQVGGNARLRQIFKVTPLP